MREIQPAAMLPKPIPIASAAANKLTLSLGCVENFASEQQNGRGEERTQKPEIRKSGDGQCQSAALAQATTPDPNFVEGIPPKTF